MSYNYIYSAIVGLRLIRTWVEAITFQNWYAPWMTRLAGKHKHRTKLYWVHLRWSTYFSMVPLSFSSFDIIVSQYDNKFSCNQHQASYVRNSVLSASLDDASQLYYSASFCCQSNVCVRNVTVLVAVLGSYIAKRNSYCFVSPQPSSFVVLLPCRTQFKIKVLPALCEELWQ